MVRCQMTFNNEGIVIIVWQMPLEYVLYFWMETMVLKEGLYIY